MAGASPMPCSSAGVCGEDRVCLVLGDNIFYAPTLGDTLKKAAANEKGATVFGYWVEDPHPSA